MSLVKIDKLVNGMVLNQDVLDSNSRLLLAKGQEIDEKHIRIMKMWGIFEVDVDGLGGGGDENQESIDSEQLMAVAQQVKQLFQGIDITHPAMNEIVKICIEHRLRFNQTVASSNDMRIKDELRGLNPREILSHIDRIDVKLPEVPSLVFELNEIIANPMSSADDIAQVINKSPSLTATLLKIVNSAFYGLRSKIDSIARAVMLMGSKEVTNLAMGITIMETFRDIPKTVLDVASFLEHNLACGVLARIIAAHGNIPQTEQLFVSGMLHDIGRLILYKYFPDYAMLTLFESKSSTIPLYKAEQKVLGCTHTHLAKRLLNKWKLPLVLVDNVAYHHTPSSAPNPAMAATVQMADIIVHGLGIGHSAEHIIPAFDANAWEKMNLSTSAFNSIIRQALHQVKNFRELLSR